MPCSFIYQLLIHKYHLCQYRIGIYDSESYIFEEAAKQKPNRIFQTEGKVPFYKSALVYYVLSLNPGIDHSSLFGFSLFLVLKTKKKGGSLKQEKHRNGSETARPPRPTTTQVCLTSYNLTNAFQLKFLFNL